MERARVEGRMAGGKFALRASAPPRIEIFWAVWARPLAGQPAPWAGYNVRRKKGRSTARRSALADLSNYKLDGSIKRLALDLSCTEIDAGSGARVQKGTGK